jgi:hypothetical protein
MAIDPSTGMDIPSPSDDFRRRRPINDLPLDRQREIVDIEHDMERRSPAFWLSIAIAVVLLAGVVYYFFGLSILS